MNNFIIESLEWKEGLLTINYTNIEQKSIVLYYKKQNKTIHPICHSENGHMVAIVDFYNHETKTIFTKGNWRIMSEEMLELANVSDYILLNIEDYTRCFYSDDSSKALIICPMVIKDEETEAPGISFDVSYVYNYTGDDKKNVKAAIRESTSIKQFIRKCFFIFAKGFLSAYYNFLASKSHRTGKNILIMSENRSSIMDNLAAIDKRIKQRGLDKDFNIRYHFRNIFKGPQNPFSWLFTIRLIAKQDYIFVDDYAPVFAFLDLEKHNTTLVQVWHAGFGFKLVGYGRFGIDGSPHPTRSCHRKYTYALIGNDYLREIYSEVFGIEKEALLSTGMPRLEHFLDKEYMKATQNTFYETFPELTDKRIITFAPTYRGSSQYNATYDFTQIDFDMLYDYCKSSNTVFIIKQHHFLREKAPIKESQCDVFYECSNYNLNDLFYVTDILITDYSSCFYDFLLLHKPVLFFTYDRAVYSATRGVHRPIDQVAPGKICDTFDELLSALQKEDYAGREASKFLQDKCATNDVLASDKVIDYILLHKKVDDILMK